MDLLTAESAREDLADALARSGPDAPTLCEGWLTADLAVHLWLRQSRVAYLVGKAAAPRLPAALAGPAATGYDRCIARARTTTGYAAVVCRFRAGPGRFNPFVVPAINRLANTMEYFIHLLDVTRAGDHDSTPPLAGAYSETLWQNVIGQWGRISMRSSPVGVTVRRPDGQYKTLQDGPDKTTRGGPGGSVVISGDLPDLVLVLSGRPGTVHLEGDDEAAAAFRHFRPRLRRECNNG